jgi:deoxyribodipyrimidine photo-lyase
MPTALVWLRRDLRLHDHPALCAAAAHGSVLPVYLHAPEEEAPWKPGGASRWWLHHSLAALEADLAERGLPLIIRSGDSLESLRALIRETGATAVHWNRLYEPACIARDQRIKEALHADGLEVHSHNAALISEPWHITTDTGTPYRVYTPFSRRLLGGIETPEILPVPEPLRAPDTLPRSEKLDALALLPRIRWDDGLAATWTPGEQGALNALDNFFDDAAGRYHSERDIPGIEGTSRLSPHLHFGELSPRQALVRARNALREDHRPGAGPSIEHFIREVVWREFAYHLIYHYPHTATQPLNERFSDFPWRQPQDYAEDLQCFQRGQTGIPIIDAGMRQLWSSGWMHNRVRMIVGSFLTKNLLIPWQEGAAWFWDTLVDADLASNTLGWQWVAGCGADAAPYFRIFNPLLQAQKFDSDGAYVRRWVPELARLPATLLHAPWEAATEPLRQAGVSLGKNYPLPIADLKATRERALAAYERVKG